MFALSHPTIEALDAELRALACIGTIRIAGTEEPPVAARLCIARSAAAIEIGERVWPLGPLAAAARPGTLLHVRDPWFEAWRRLSDDVLTLVAHLLATREVRADAVALEVVFDEPLGVWLVPQTLTSAEERYVARVLQNQKNRAQG